MIAAECANHNADRIPERGIFMAPLAEPMPKAGRDIPDINGHARSAHVLEAVTGGSTCGPIAFRERPHAVLKLVRACDEEVVRELHKDRGESAVDHAAEGRCIGVRIDGDRVQDLREYTAVNLGCEETTVVIANVHERALLGEHEEASSVSLPEVQPTFSAEVCWRIAGLKQFDHGENPSDQKSYDNRPFDRFRTAYTEGDGCEKNFVYTSVAIADSEPIR